MPLHLYMKPQNQQRQTVLKRFYLIIAILLLPFTAFAQKTAADSLTLHPREVADRLIDIASQYIGYPYKYGASGPKSFDCAGFAMFNYKKIGIELSRSSRTQANDGRAVEGDFSALQKGDLLIFSGSRGGKTPGHVGVFISLTEDGKDLTFIHSDHSGVRISYLSEPYYKKRFLKVRRVLPDFPPEEEKNEAVYPFDTEVQAFVHPDTLQLGRFDERIVLFEGGKWAVVDPDGRVIVPDGGSSSTIVLYPDGSWRNIVATGMRIPGSPEPAPAKTTEKPATEAVQVNDADAVYYTIKSGDTLSKIASQYHTTVKSLCSLNGITERTVLRIGKKLRVK